MAGAVVLAAAVLAYTVVWLALAVAMALAAKVPVRVASVGLGPGWIVARVGGVDLRVGAMPFGGFVQGPEEGLPGWLGVVPHLCCAVPAWVLAPPALESALLAWVGGWLGLGEVRLGLAHGLARAAALASVDPVDAALGVGCALGAFNMVFGAVQALARARLPAPVSAAVTLGWAVVVLGLGARGVWLDLF